MEKRQRGRPREPQQTLACAAGARAPSSNSRYRGSCDPDPLGPDRDRPEGKLRSGPFLPWAPAFAGIAPADAAARKVNFNLSLVSS